MNNPILHQYACAFIIQQTVLYQFQENGFLMFNIIYKPITFLLERKISSYEDREMNKEQIREEIVSVSTFKIVLRS